jgi:cob(I)alamin adenosyltransferase
MRAWTGRGDDGTTGLLFGGRVGKDAAEPAALGAVDEAQAALGLARAEAERGGELDSILRSVERDLYVLMGELATAPANRSKLEAGRTLVTPAMVETLERVTEDVVGRFEMPTEFVLPGENRIAALLDVARTVVRRAERAAVPVAVEGSSVLPYLNRLSTLAWALARWQEDDHPLSKEEHSWT